MSRYVLALAGSPRRHGNSETLLDEAIRAFEDEGLGVERLVVAGSGIQTCRGCNACSKDGRCVIDDAMQDVYPIIDDAAALIVATPVYFATVPAVLKTLYDRLQPYWARRYVLGQEPKRRRPGGIIVVGGGGDPYGTGCAVQPTKSIFGVLGIDCLGVVEVEGVDARGDIEERPQAAEGAVALARELAAEVRR